MGNLKFITFTDVHVSPVNPASRKGSYEQDIINKLEQIKALGIEEKVDFFIFAGDLFHLKAPLRNTHELNTILINLFKTFPAPIYATEGNHDLRNDSYDTFSEQPMKVLYSSDALIQARDIRGNKNGISFRVRSIPFQEEPDLSLIERAKGDDLSIFILHLYATYDGGMFFKTRLFSYHEIAALMDDVFVLGHYHLDQGIQTVSDFGKDQYFVNVGAVSRGSLNEDDVKRQPKVALISVTKEEDGKVSIEHNAIPLKVKSIAEAFDVVVHEREKKEQKEAEEFVSKLKTEMVDVEKEDRIADEVSQLGLEKKVLDKVNYFLNEAHLQRKLIE